MSRSSLSPSVEWIRINFTSIIIPTLLSYNCLRGVAAPSKSHTYSYLHKPPIQTRTYHPLHLALVGVKTTLLIILSLQTWFPLTHTQLNILLQLFPSYPNLGLAPSIDERCQQCSPQMDGIYLREITICSFWIYPKRCQCLSKQYHLLTFENAQYKQTHGAY